MNTADKIAEYSAAAAESGLHVISIIIEKGKVSVNFAPQPVDHDSGDGLAKDWTPK